MSGESEKQGHLGNLDEKTVPELLELLQRQEKLLKKEKFLRSLHDQGRKVRKFAETLRQLISQREDVDDAASRLQGVRIGVEDISEDSPIASTPSVTITSEFQKLRDKHESSEELALAKGDVTGLNRKPRGDNSEPRGDKSVRTGEGDEADSLSECLERVTLSTELRHGEQDQFVNSYERVIKRANEKYQKKSFKPYSTLNISRVQDLPDNLKLRSRQENECDISDSHQSMATDSAHTNTCSADRTSSHTMVHEESAVYLPTHKYDKAVLISVEESVQLDADRKKRLGELQMAHAAERLASRLHIRLEDYNPEETNMNYREPAGCVTDSDDEPEVEGYHDDNDD